MGHVREFLYVHASRNLITNGRGFFNSFLTVDFMKCVIMGAGSGTRMFPLTHFINKHLLHLGGKPVIRIIAERLLKSIPSEDIIIVCNTKDEKDYEWEFRDMPVKFYTFGGDQETMGTARQFATALVAYTPKLGEPVLLHYGDTITDLDYGKFINRWTDYKMDADGMLAITSNIKHDYSQVNYETISNRIMKIVEKPKLSFPSWTGIAIFNARKIEDEVRDFIDEQSKQWEVDLAYHIFPRMVAKKSLIAYEYDGRWFDVGNLRSYRLLVEEFQNKDLNL